MTRINADYYKYDNKTVIMLTDETRHKLLSKVLDAWDLIESPIFYNLLNEDYDIDILTGIPKIIAPFGFGRNEDINLDQIQKLNIALKKLKMSGIKVIKQKEFTERQMFQRMEAHREAIKLHDLNEKYKNQKKEMDLFKTLFV